MVLAGWSFSREVRRSLTYLLRVCAAESTFDRSRPSHQSHLELSPAMPLSGPTNNLSRTRVNACESVPRPLRLSRLGLMPTPAPISAFQGRPDSRNLTTNWWNLILPPRYLGGLEGRGANAPVPSRPNRAHAKRGLGRPSVSSDRISGKAVVAAIRSGP